MAAGSQLDLTFAFMTGIAGSGHCLGMCGALVSAFFRKFGARHPGPMPYFVYHAARVGVYVFIGVLAAALGAALVSTGAFGAAQGILQILAGVVVILLGLNILGLSAVRLPLCGISTAAARGWFQRATEKGPVVGAAMGGTLNGFMPCTLTFAMAIKATTAATPLDGGLLLLAFGAGTLPSMLFVSVAFGRLGARFRGWLLKGAAVIVIVMGLQTIYQGFTYFNIMRGLVNW